MLEHSVSTDRPNGRFLAVSGLRFSWTTTHEAGSRIQDVEVMQSPENIFKPLRPEKEYKFVLPKFLLGGGDDYGMLLLEATPISPLWWLSSDSNQEALYAKVDGTSRTEPDVQDVLVSVLGREPKLGPEQFGIGVCLHTRLPCVRAYLPCVLCAVLFAVLCRAVPCRAVLCCAMPGWIVPTCLPGVPCLT